MKTLSKKTIKTLNKLAIDMVESGEELWPSDALEEVARLHRYEVVNRCSDTVLFRSRSGLYVNCWLGEVGSDQIEEGGLGFDDIIEIHDV